MPLTELQIATLVERYLRERDRFDKMASTVARHLSAQLRASAIPHLPTFRAKDADSLSSKLTRDREKHEFSSFDREFAPSLLDLAGVRILLYRPRDQDPTCDVIERLFIVPTEERFRKDFLEPGGYQARHRVVLLRDEVLASDPSFLNLVGVYCEVQVVTIGDHIWNELQHDILYKTPTGMASSEQVAFLATLRDQLNSVRSSVHRLMEATERQRESKLTTIESPEDLSEALRSRTGRRLRGDFSGLLRLLKAALTTLTRADLDRLPLDVEDLEGASNRLHSATIGDADDIALVISALWPLYGRDFSEIAHSWRGRPGPVARIVLVLESAQGKGSI